MPPREEPSEPLVELLERLGLARRDELHAARHHARKLARDLPWFDSVWVDALVARRLLTPYQARTINAGLGESLGVGPYVLLSPLVGLGYADRYAAREIATRREVWLTIGSVGQVPAESAREALASLAHRLGRVGSPEITPIEASGVVRSASESGSRIWMVSPACDGANAGQWTIRNGRWPVAVVEEIARQTATSLAALEAHDVLHGDLSVANLFIASDGAVRLASAGLRPIVRPEEGYAHADLPPEAFDYLAPERVADGTPTTRQSDVYAFGCLCWHLLIGRAPLSGGNSLGKLQAAHEAKILDVRRLALDVPPVLAEVIAHCLQPDPRRRPLSFASLADRLGPSSIEGRTAAGRFVQSPIAMVGRLALAADTMRHSRHTPVWTATIAGCILLSIAIAWPWWRGAARSSVAHANQRTTQSQDDSKNSSADAKSPAEPNALPRDFAPTAGTAPPVPSAGVIPVAYTSFEPAAPVLELDADRSVDVETIVLKPGMIIRSPRAKRVRIVTPPQGWQINVDGVRFENIDFVSATAEPSLGELRAAVVILAVAARQIELRGCTLRSNVAAGDRCKAIAWNSPHATDTDDQLAAAAQLRLVDCVLDGVSVGVDCPTGHPLLLEFDNTLHLGPGPLWRLNDCPTSDVQVVLERVTIRDAVSLVDVRYDSLADEPGQMSIEANDCVFATGPKSTLLRLAGRHQPDPLLRRVEWTGQGSLLGPIDRFAIWYDIHAKPHAVDDATLEVDGLASGTFEFAGQATDGPAASQIVRWAAPLRSAEPPGIRPAPLGWPSP